MKKPKFLLGGLVIYILTGMATMTIFSGAHPPRPDGSRIDHKVPEDDLYKSPIQMAISKDGRRLYVVCERANVLQVVDTQRKEVLAEVSVGRHPYGVTLTPDERVIYVSNRWDDTVSMIEAQSFQLQHVSS